MARALTIVLFSVVISVLTVAVGLAQVPFEIPLVASDGVDTVRSYFGIRPGADVCVNPADSMNGHAETFLSPPPPSGLFDSRFVSPRTINAGVCYNQGTPHDYRPFFSSAQQDTFRLRTQPGLGSTIAISWPSNLSTHFASLTLRYFDLNLGQLISVNMLTQFSADVTAAGDPAIVTIFCNNTAGPVTPQFSLEPSSISFGAVPPGQMKTDSTVVSNPGTATLHISSVMSDHGMFTVQPAAPESVVAGGSVKFYVTFAPTMPTPQSGTISFFHDAAGSPGTLLVSSSHDTGSTQFAVPLTVTDDTTTKTLYFGFLQGANQCLYNGDSLNGHAEFFLAPTPPGGVFDARLISPRTANALACYDQGTLVDFRPPNGFPSGRDTFRVKSQLGLGASLHVSWPAGLSTYFMGLVLRYFDQNLGQNINVNMLTNTSANITDAGDPAIATIFSSGLVQALPLFQANPTSLGFGSVHLAASKQDSIIVTDIGSVPFSISSAVSTNPQFTVSPLSATVPALGSVKFTVTFSPNAEGVASGKIIFNSNAVSLHDTIPVTGTGTQGHFLVTPGSLSFDSVFVTSTKTDSITVRNNGTGTLTISGIASSDPTFTVAESAPRLIAVQDSIRIHVAFHPTGDGLKSGVVRFTHDGSSSQDSIFVTGTGYHTVSLQIPITAGWNLIANPVNDATPGDSVRQLFPTSFTPYAYEFAGGYTTRYILARGKGYWEKFIDSLVNPITGTPRTHDSLAVNAGWNIIGGIGVAVDTGTIVSVPVGLRASSWYGYTTFYAPVTRLLPGKGYWIKANTTGKFVLDGAFPPARPQTGMPDPLATLNRFTIRDNTGRAQTLYFGSAPIADTRMYTMPPVPPAGAFDARFVSGDGGTMVAIHDAGPTRGFEFPVQFQTDAYPVTVSWMINAGTSGYVLSYGSGDGIFAPQEMSREGTITIANSSVKTLTLKVRDVVRIPASFALAQNYPNPFNPSTTIRYDLPTDAHVRLRVFNVLGQEVVTLVDEEQKAGYRSIMWNGTGKSSGVYYYKIEAGSFTGVRRLILVK